MRTNLLSCLQWCLRFSGCLQRVCTRVVLWCAFAFLHGVPFLVSNLSSRWRFVLSVISDMTMPWLCSATFFMFSGHLERLQSTLTSCPNSHPPRSHPVLSSAISFTTCLCKRCVASISLRHLLSPCALSFPSFHYLADALTRVFRLFFPALSQSAIRVSHTHHHL